MTNPKGMPISGTVTARNCPTCGHHEIGLVSEDGVFRPLKTGTRVLITDDREQVQPPIEREEAQSSPQTAETPPPVLEGRYWIPEPLKGDRRMRLKYGVLIPEETVSAPLKGHMYESAYLRKLMFLIEKEEYVPIAVILDRFFVAPHLASGETRDVATNMWEELEEVRRPVERIREWLEAPGKKALERLVHPLTPDNLENAPVSEEEALEEQRSLDLEAFLEWL